MSSATISGRTITLALAPTSSRESKEERSKFGSDRWTIFCGSMQLRSAMQRYKVSVQLALSPDGKLPAESLTLDEQRCSTLIDLGSTSIIKCEIDFVTLDVNTAGRDTAERKDHSTSYFALYDGVRNIGEYNMAKGLFEPACDKKTCRGTYDKTAVAMFDERQRQGSISRTQLSLNRTTGQIQIGFTDVDVNQSFATGRRRVGKGICTPSELPPVPMAKF